MLGSPLMQANTSENGAFNRRRGRYNKRFWISFTECPARRLLEQYWLETRAARADDASGAHLWLPSVPTGGEHDGARKFSTVDLGEVREEDELPLCLFYFFFVSPHLHFLLFPRWKGGCAKVPSNN